MMEAAEKNVKKKYVKFLFWLGFPQHRHSELPPHDLAAILSDFSFKFKQQMEEIREAKSREDTLRFVFFTYLD